MSKRNLKLLAVFLALAAAVYIYKYPFSHWQQKAHQPANPLAGLNTDKITKIEVITDKASTTLERQDKKLKVAGSKDFYVRQDLADMVFDRLKEAAQAEIELVSANKNRWANFDLSPERQIRVKLYSGDKLLADILVGKISSDFNRTYIALPGSEKVYALKARLRSAFDQDEWRDRTIFSADKDKITKIRFQYPNREFTIEKKDGQWQGTIPYKFKVDKDKIDEILNIMSHLTAQKIPEQKFAGTGLEKHKIIIEAQGDGIDNILMVGDETKDGLVYAKRGDSDNIYLISKEQRDELDKRIRDLR